MGAQEINEWRYKKDVMAIMSKMASNLEEINESLKGLPKAGSVDKKATMATDDITNVNFKFNAIDSPDLELSVLYAKAFAEAIDRIHDILHSGDAINVEFDQFNEELHFSRDADDFDIFFHRSNGRGETTYGFVGNIDL